MSERETHLSPESAAPPAAPLFAWRGDEIVLLGEQAGGRWIVARGWRHGDRLTDVRRWSFATPEGFVTQVRRLAREATGNLSLAAETAAAALSWTAAQSTTGATIDRRAEPLAD